MQMINRIENLPSDPIVLSKEMCCDSRDRPSTWELLNKHTLQRLNEYAGIRKYLILTEYLSSHILVFEGFFPQRINLGLVIKQTAQQDHLTQTGCNENYQVEG